MSHISSEAPIPWLGFVYKRSNGTRLKNSIGYMRSSDLVGFYGPVTRVDGVETPSNQLLSWVHLKEPKKNN